MSYEKERNSNLELLRIILMLSVVMHHCIFASGIDQLYDLKNNFLNTFVLQCLGAWGKVAINAYVLISGYFMCKSKLRWEKVLKLVLEIKFYEIILYLFLILLGVQELSLMGILKIFFSIGINVNKSFVSSFVAFYLFIPFYNKLIYNMNKREFKYLLVLFFFAFTVVGTVLSNWNVFTHLTWYMILYFFAAYIRLYPNAYTESSKINLVLTIVFVISAYASILLIDLVHLKSGLDISCYYLVMNSHKILAFLIAIFIFLWFKNIKIKNSKLINIIASGTFGVLLIHTNSEAMSKLIWNTILNVTKIINSNPIKITMYVLFCTLVVYSACTVVDILRIIFLEKPLFKIIDNKRESISRAIKGLEKKILH